MEAYIKQLTIGIQELLSHETEDMKVDVRFNGEIVTYGKIMPLIDSTFTNK
jgi:hypothetical protein